MSNHYAQSGGPHLKCSRVRDRLRCPRCLSALEQRGTVLTCEGKTCRTAFPVVDGVPVLIDEDRSVFRISDFTQRKGTYFPHESRFRKVVKKLVPDIGVNLSAEKNYGELKARLLSPAHGRRVVLILGGGIEGVGLQVLSHPDLELLHTDVALTPQVDSICDAHAIPLSNASVDAVVAQAVLEHVADPWLCVEEIHRVLKPGGYVYAETPFMQQVHGGRYDFTRFTHVGYLRLFRRFEEIASGAVAGPGTALAWSWQYFLMSFAATGRGRDFARLLARLTAFHLKHLDRLLVNRAGGLDAASGYYYLGARSESIRSDRATIAMYRGAS
jgi:SAM-dependent methyltransferase